MNQKEPLLSIVIPVYNAEKYLKQTLSSLQEQSLKQIEIICVDDGSTDHSIDIIKEFMTDDSRIRLYLNEGKYAGPARNKGLKEAKGIYIHFLDADDYVLDYGYETVLQKARQNDLDCIKFSAIAYDENLDLPVYKGYYNYDRIGFDDLDRIITNDDHLATILCVTPWSGIYRRDFLLNNHIYFNDLICINDRSFHQNILMYCGKLMITRDRVVIHRINVSNSLVMKRIENFDCYRRSIDIVEKDLIESPVPFSSYEEFLMPELDDLLIWFETALKIGQETGKVLSITSDILYRYSRKYPFCRKLLIRFFKIIIKAILKISRNPEEYELCEYSFAEYNKPSISVMIDIEENKVHLSTILNALARKQYPDIEYLLYSPQPDKLSKLIISEFSNIDHRFSNTIYKDEEDARSHARGKAFLVYSSMEKRCIVSQNVKDSA